VYISVEYDNLLPLDETLLFNWIIVLELVKLNDKGDLLESKASQDCCIMNRSTQVCCDNLKIAYDYRRRVEMSKTRFIRYSKSLMKSE